MTFLYASIQFLYWFAYGTAVNFSSVFLLDRGMSSTMIGLISAAACTGSLLLQPVLAAYADRPGSLSVKRILLLLLLLMTAVSFGLMLMPDTAGIPQAVMLGSAILMIQLALPLVNALATETINAGGRLHFSAARGVGSIGYACMSFSLGRLAAEQGSRIIPQTLALVVIALLAVTACFPFRKKEREQSVRHEGSIRAYPGFPAVLAGCALIYTSHALINSFVYQIVLFKGGNSGNMGFVMGLAGLLEVLTMFGFSRLLRWRSCSFWFRICGVFFTLKCLGTLLAGSMEALYAVQLFQPLGWGLMTVSSVYYVNERMKEQDKIKGQAFMTMTLALGTIAGTLTGGWLIDHAGVPGMLAAATLCGAAGTAIVMRMVHTSSTPFSPSRS